MNWIRRGLTTLVLSLVAITAANAQSNGPVRGILTDPNGASAPNASVTLVNKETDQRFQTLTTDGGAYSFTFLAPVTYELSAELPGFKRIVREVRVDVAATVTIDTAFELGQAATSVQVTSESE